MATLQETMCTTTSSSSIAIIRTMQFINFMSAGYNRFGQHDTISKRSPHISRASFCRMRCFAALLQCVVATVFNELHQFVTIKIRMRVTVIYVHVDENCTLYFHLK